MGSMDDSEGRKRKLGSVAALRTPEQREAPKDTFLLKSREVKRWAAELPIANTGETARQTYKTLVAFNRIQVPTLARAHRSRSRQVSGARS